jgi:DMSO/TMAO reductase YedYZ molybdopterin-dependent catalytic subunit
MSIINPGFGSKRTEADPNRIPPGQYVVRDWPVLTYGPTPRTPIDQWSLEIDGLVETPQKWNWDEFRVLKHSSITRDISCVTRWTKFDMEFEGVSLDELFALAKPKHEAKFILASCDGDYTTNLPLDEVIDGKAMVAFNYEGAPLTPEHGGPARLVVPALYFWKSAKWIRKITLMDHDQSGFWEINGYNNHGDPWKEERYWGE